MKTPIPQLARVLHCKRGRGQPAKEPTRLIRAYSADVPRLMRHGKTQAEAVRALLKIK